MNNYKIKMIFAVILSTAFAVAFFLKPEAFVDGMRKGLTVCGSSVIPSLFPFMVLSDFILRSGLGGVRSEKLSKLIGFLFALPGEAGSAILMSLVGGFPVGARMTAQLYQNGSITARQGRRMLVFCVNAGPAFVIGTVGTIMLSSRKAGVILFASLTVSSLAAGICSRIIDSDTKSPKTGVGATFDPSVLPDSVGGSVQAIFNVCAWIMTFSGINEFLSCLPLSKSAAVWLSAFTEVTGGCLNVSKHFPTCIIALVLGWSGLAVHCQLLPYIGALDMKLSHFWASRMLVGGLATAVAAVLFKLFPCEVSVFSNAAQIISKPYSVSAPVAAAMLVLSALMLTDIKLARNQKV